MSARISMILVLISSMLMGHAANTSAQDFKEQELTQFFEHLYEHNRWMGSVAIMSGGEVIYRHAAGYADVESEAPNTPETRHRVGSVTKPFTAVMILQLVERGEITLEDPLSDYFPDMPNAGEITLRDMLYHRSGLYNFTNDPEYPDYMTEPKSREEMLEKLAGYDPVFEPGERNEYSNANYVLLGYIIEEVTGRDYQQVLESQITEPLELEDTYYGGSVSAESGEAFSYSYAGNQWQLQPETDMSIPHGAGSMVSRPQDLTTFIHALFDGQLIGQELLDEMIEIEENYGMGLFSYPYQESTGFGHSGGIDGYQSNLAYYPDEDLAVAITTNFLSYSQNDILIAMLDAWHGKAPELPDFDTVELEESYLEKMAGEYESGQIPLDITLRVSGGQLMAQATGQSEFPLDAQSETRFRFDQAGVIIEFEQPEGEDGEFTTFTLHQAGGQYRFQRK